MAAHSSFRGPTHRNKARKALRDKKQRERVGEATWQRWKAEASKDKAFLWFGLIFIVGLGVLFFSMN